MRDSLAALSQQIGPLAGTLAASKAIFGRQWSQTSALEANSISIRRGRGPHFLFRRLLPVI